MNEPDDTRSPFQRDWDALRVLEQPPPSGSIGPWLSKRYSNAYTAAHAIVIIGKAIKAIAIIMFVIVLIAGFSLGSGGGYATGGFALALIVGIPVFILGIIVAALGQIALATLDTAVNTSRHLTNDELAAILSKRFSR
ncbi:MAG TPA: hypothetical protein VGW39_11755 [Chthoniobacterales bacterium]|nr:hypothetical protein [Chthoniobacterales bacterium]